MPHKTIETKIEKPIAKPKKKDCKKKNCPRKKLKEVVKEGVTTLGDNNTTTIPTNQNAGKGNGNFCGNSISIVIINGLPLDDATSLAAVGDRIKNALEILEEKKSSSE